MRYLMLLYGDESAYASATPEQMGQMLADYNAFHGEMAQRGTMLAAERLQPSMTATTVSVSNGKTITTDGPFVETKEQLAGIYVFECKDLDEAIEVAAKIPAARHGKIEVRPIMEVPTEEELANLPQE
jgi:hypothetical protein